MPEGNKLTLGGTPLPGEQNRPERNCFRTPYKTVSYEKYSQDGAPVMLITEQKAEAWPPSLQNGKWKATM